MSKSANSGELRTPVYFKKISRGYTANRVPTEIEENVFGEGTFVMAKWVNAHGTDALVAMQMSMRDPATLTVRYSPKIDNRLIVYCGADPEPYEIVSIDNVEMRNQWLEIKVQRRLPAR